MDIQYLLCNSSQTQEYLEREHKRARISSPSRASSEMSKSPVTEISMMARRLSLEPRSQKHCNIGTCHICRSDHVSQNEHGNGFRCESCGASLSHENEYMCCFQLGSPCSCHRRFGCRDVCGTSQTSSRKDPTSVSKRPVHRSCMETKNRSIVNYNKDDMSTLRDMVYNFCESLSLPVRTAHRALSISREHLDHLKSYKTRGRRDRRKNQTHKGVLLDVASASVLISSRQFNNGVTLKQVSKATQVDMAYIVDRKKKIEEFTGGKEATHGNNLFGISSRVCNMLMLSQELANAVYTLAEGAMQLDDFHGMHCSTVVASCLYLVVRVAGALCTKEDISNACCVSWHSMRNTYNRLVPNARDLLPEAFNRMYSCDMPKVEKRAQKL